MRHFIPVAIAVAFLLTLPVFADDYKIGALEIEQPWARATPGGVTNGAAYFTLHNRGYSAERLVGVESRVAKRTELHASVEENGVMKMKPLGAVDVPPGGMATFAPGGMHVMLMGLSAPLVEGQEVPLTLIFEHAGRADISVTVEKLGARKMHHHDGHQRDHHSD